MSLQAHGTGLLIVWLIYKCLAVLTNWNCCIPRGILLVHLYKFRFYGKMYIAHMTCFLGVKYFSLSVILPIKIFQGVSLHLTSAVSRSTRYFNACSYYIQSFVLRYSTGL